jgi:hypothetical protein
MVAYDEFGRRHILEPREETTTHSRPHYPPLGRALEGSAYPMSTSYGAGYDEYDDPRGPDLRDVHLSSPKLTRNPTGEL